MKFKVIQKAKDIEVSYKLFDTIEEATKYYYSLDNDTDKYIVPVGEKKIKELPIIKIPNGGMQQLLAYQIINYKKIKNDKYAYFCLKDKNGEEKLIVSEGDDSISITNNKIENIIDKYELLAEKAARNNIHFFDDKWHKDENSKILVKFVSAILRAL